MLKQGQQQPPQPPPLPQKIVGDNQPSFKMFTSEGHITTILIVPFFQEIPIIE